MLLNQLRQLAGCSVPSAAADVSFTSVSEDSRRAGPGALFVAASGEHADGHDYAAQAVASGAVAVLGARKGIEVFAGAPYVYAEHPRRALGIAAHALAGDPSRAMTVIGITGTNGKTSSVLMTAQLLNHARRPAAVFGTVGYTIGGETIDARHTTPFGEELAALFARARDAGMTHVAMEASSHAIEQERIAGIRFKVAAFTNLTQDHLDYHRDMDTYLRAKLALFERVEGDDAFTVVNLADSSAKAFIAASKARCITVNTPRADCRAENIRFEAQRSLFHAYTPWGDIECTLPLLGRHNVANALGVIAICGGLGLSLGEIADGLASLPQVPGRFEQVDAGQPFQVVVDYAHTDDGLRNVLQAARAICRGRVIVVFGCGGDRDKGKRPKMGAAAAELANRIIVTSDNPRSEDPERIMLDIEVGLQRAGKRKGDDYEMVLDRTEAIQRAIGIARAGDLVLIAGKGHETYQIFADRRIHFDDREVVRAILEAR